MAKVTINTYSDFSGGSTLYCTNHGIAVLKLDRVDKNGVATDEINKLINTLIDAYAVDDGNPVEIQFPIDAYEFNVMQLKEGDCN